MEITEIRVSLVHESERHDRKVFAYCSVAFDNEFVVKDVKIIEGWPHPLVAMPHRILQDKCPECHWKNSVLDAYCRNCGAELDEDRAPVDELGRRKVYLDVCHPINSEFRAKLYRAVMDAYESKKAEDVAKPK